MKFSTTLPPAALLLPFAATKRCRAVLIYRFVGHRQFLLRILRLWPIVSIWARRVPRVSRGSRPGTSRQPAIDVYPDRSVRVTLRPSAAADGWADAEWEGQVLAADWRKAVKLTL